MSSDILGAELQILQIRSTILSEREFSQRRRYCFFFKYLDHEFKEMDRNKKDGKMLLTFIFPGEREKELGVG